MKYFFTIILTLVFLTKCYSQDSCYCDNLQITVEAKNLFNEVRIVKTRNKLDSFVLYPIEITVKLNYTKPFYTYFYSFTESTTIQYNRIAKNPLHFNLDSINLDQILFSLERPLVAFKPKGYKELFNMIDIEKGSNHEFFTFYEKDNMSGDISNETRNFLSLDSLGAEYSDTNYTYKYVYDRNDLLKTIVNDSLELYYFQIPSRLLELLGAKKCYAKSNRFILPSAKDTILIIDRLDTIIDHKFYAKYPHQNSILEDVCVNFLYDKIFLDYNKFSDSLERKYNLKLKIKEFEKDGNKKYLIKGKNLKLICNSYPNENSNLTKLLLTNITYYPSKNEYLFLGLYEGDFMTYQIIRLNELDYKSIKVLKELNPFKLDSELNIYKAKRYKLFDSPYRIKKVTFGKFRKTIKKVELKF